MQAGTSDGWITKLAVGEYMDVVPTAVGGSDTTYFSDYYWGNPGSRVLFRSYNNAYSLGGVAFANALNDASDTYNYVGARLKIQKIKIYVIFFINVTNNTTLHLMQKTNFKTIKQNSFSKVIEEDVFYWKAKN